MNHINFFKYFSEKNKNKDNASSASLSASLSAEPTALPIQKKEPKGIFSFKNSKKNKNRIKKEETEENAEQNCRINTKHNLNKMLNTNLLDKNINQTEKNHQESVLTDKYNTNNTDTNNSNNSNNKCDKDKWIPNTNMNNEQIKAHMKNTHLLKKKDKKYEREGVKEYEKKFGKDYEKEYEKERDSEGETEKEYGKEENFLNCEYETRRFENSQNKDEKLKNFINFTEETKRMGVKENKTSKNKILSMFFTKRNNKNEKQKLKEDSILKKHETPNENYQEKEKGIQEEIQKEMAQEMQKDKQKNMQKIKEKEKEKEKKRIFKNKDILFDGNKESDELKNKIHSNKKQNQPIFYSNNIYYCKNKMNPENVKMQTSVKKENSCDTNAPNNPKEKNTNVDNMDSWNNYIKYLDNNFQLNGNKLLYRRSLSGEAVNRNDIMSVDNIEPISSSAHIGTTLKKKENKKHLINFTNQFSNSKNKFNFFNYNTGRDTQTNGTNAADVVLTRNEYVKWLQKQNQLLQKNTNTYFKDNMANCFMNVNNEFVTRNKYNLTEFNKCINKNNINNYNNKNNINNIYTNNNNSESGNNVMNNSNRSNARQKRRSISLTERNSVEIGPQHFMFLKVIGKGSYGKVLLVKYMKDNKLYAMKILRKDNIATKSQLEHTQIERNVLKNVVHPFIVKLYYAFQTSTKLYFILEYCPGGELFFHLSKFKEFSEEIVKFYAAEVILALQYLHEMDIIYRDLKPENILLDEQGHIRLTDFGLSKDGIKDNFSATSLCGTPEYLAPEIISQTGHGKAVDWWSLGIMIFEMLTGSLPFNSSNRKVLFDRITYTELHYPKKISPTAVDLLKKLFEKNPRKRLGSGKTDADEIKSHPFFKNVNWDAVLQKKIKPPFKPPLFDKNDMQNFDKEFLCMALRHSDQFDKTTCNSNRKKYVHLSGFNYACEQAASKQ